MLAGRHIQGPSVIDLAESMKVSPEVITMLKQAASKRQ
jgi:hypothetical protein